MANLHHGLRHYRRRPSQLLGGACCESTSATTLQTCRHRVRHWLDLRARRSRSHRAWFPKQHPLRPLFLGQAAADPKPQPTINMLLRHGVRSCLEYQKTGDIAKARSASNPALSPHLSFVDMGGHGYAVVSASSTAFETEFVCIPRPLERAPGDDGGPLAYRVLILVVVYRLYSYWTPALEGIRDRYKDYFSVLSFVKTRGIKGVV